MTKPVFLFFISMISSFEASACTQKPNTVSLLAHYISMECGIEPTVVERTIERLHRRYGITRVIFSKSPTNANYYFPGTIRMNIADSNRMCEMWVAELSHAIQFCTRPVRSTLQTARDGIKTLVRMCALTPPERRDAKKLKASCGWFKAAFWTAWQRLYHEPGSLEYEAHQLIERTLTMEIGTAFHSPQ